MRKFRDICDGVHAEIPKIRINKKLFASTCT